MKRIFATLRIVILLAVASFLIFSFYIVELFKNIFVKKANADVPSSSSASSGSTSSSNSGSAGSSGDST